MAIDSSEKPSKATAPGLGYYEVLGLTRSVRGGQEEENGACNVQGLACRVRPAQTDSLRLPLLLLGSLQER